MIVRHPSPALLALVAAGSLACNNSTSGPGTLRAVEFRVVATHAAASAAASGPVEITSLRLVVGPAALGNGDQFGCADCQGGGNDSGPEAGAAPQLIRVPTDGSSVSVATEQVQAGRYGSAEIELQHPDASITTADPTWPSDATIEVGGAINSVPFTLHLALEGAFRETLNPPVDVTDTGTPGTLSVTVTLPVAAWFMANGSPLDPNDPAQRAQIEQNARSALSPIEAGELSGEI
jgi:hypothetical protein